MAVVPYLNPINQLILSTQMKMEHSEEEARLSAMQLATGSVLPMVLRSAIELHLFELINNSDRPNVSASEIAAKLSTTNPDAPDLLDRILRLLAVHSVLACSGGAGGERRYSLTPMGKFFTKDEDGISIAQLALFIQDKVMIKSWYSLKDAIMEGGTPFSRAHGMSLFEFTAMDDRMSNIFNQAMSHSTIHLKQLIHTYKGFEGINTLVDVGGGSGTTLNMIVSKYPSIKGINFDLPHVVRDAPSFPDIEHVGGDMFVSVPKGDAIFMKWIIHNWSDESCLKILKNCKEALPENGKVIIVDFVLSELPKNGPTAFGVEMDVMMLAFTQGGKERTKIEFQTLAKAAGFKEFRYVCSVFTMGVIELYK